MSSTPGALSSDARLHFFHSKISELRQLEAHAPSPSLRAEYYFLIRQWEYLTEEVARLRAVRGGAQ